MNNLIETVTLGGGLIVALFGVWTSIRSRQRDDKKAEAAAGIEAVQNSKLVQDIAINLQDTYLQRVQANVELLETELARTKKRLAEALAEKGIQHD